MKEEKANMDSSNLSHKEDKKRQSFVMILKDSSFVDQTSVKNHASNTTCSRSYTSESEKEQNKHAIVVAAATTVAADAAVAAAQAAMTVVTLTSQRRGVVSANGRDKWAAIVVTESSSGSKRADKTTSSCSRLPCEEASTIVEKGGEWLHELALHNKILEILNFYMTELAEVSYQDLNS